MKLYEKIPDSVRVNGKRVRVNLDFRRVLKMINILEDDSLLPESREWLALKCICKRPKTGMMPEVMKLLFPQTGQHDKITDFDQDADMIMAAFLQVYGINLYRDKLNWFEFMSLLACIPEGSKYSEVLSIRARPMPEPTPYNSSERQWLAQAKTQYGIRLTEKEQAQKYKRDVERLSDFLMAMAGEE